MARLTISYLGSDLQTFSVVVAGGLTGVEVV
jgi:hypothetical protein